MRRIVQLHNTPNGRAARARYRLPEQRQDSRFHSIPVAALDAFCPRRWFSSVSETIISFYARRRREQQIKKAIAALSELDERMLRDIGLFSRSEIEQSVRSSGEK